MKNAELMGRLVIEWHVPEGLCQTEGDYFAMGDLWDEYCDMIQTLHVGVIHRIKQRGRLTYKCS